MTRDVLFYRHSDVWLSLSFSLPQCTSSRNWQVDGVLHDHWVLLSFERSSFAIHLLNVLLLILDSCILRLFPAIRNLRKIFFWWQATPFLAHLREWWRIIAQYVWSSDVPWRWPRLTYSVIWSCKSDWMMWHPFSGVTWAFFSCNAVNPPRFIIQKTVANLLLLTQPASFGRTSLLNMVLAALVRRLFVVKDSSFKNSFPNLSDPSLKLMTFLKISDGTVS